METYRVIKPSPILAPFIKNYWVLKIDASAPVTERTIPIGCVHLTFHKGKQLFSIAEKEFQPKVFVSGQTTFYSDVSSTGCLDMISVAFQPYAAKMFFQIPVNEFCNRNVSVDDMDDIELMDLGKRISDTPDDDLCIRYIELFLINRLCKFPEYNMKRVTAAINEINIQPKITVTELSQIACLSNKQFGRVFTEYIGITPKEFIRVIRLQRALFLLQNSPYDNYAQLAFDCGFYDQSHLIKEFKGFSGYTPNEYLAICDPYSDYFSSL
jgi:AraC-like DNA-binding protein